MLNFRYQALTAYFRDIVFVVCPVSTSFIIVASLLSRLTFRFWALRNKNSENITNFFSCYVQYTVAIDTLHVHFVAAVVTLHVCRECCTFLVLKRYYVKSVSHHVYLYCRRRVHLLLPLDLLTWSQTTPLATSPAPRIRVSTSSSCSVSETTVWSRPLTPPLQYPTIWTMDSGTEQ